MSFKQTAEQVAIVEAALNGDSLVIQAFAGASKAQPLWSPVQTPYGEKPIGSMKIGDLIFRKDGSIGCVTGVFPQGLKDTYRVYFRDGSYTHCNLDHLWTVFSKTKNKWVTMSLGELLSIGLNFPSGNSRWKIPLTEPVTYAEKDFLIDPYVMGILLGDGYLLNSIQFSVGSGDDKIKSLVSSRLPVGYEIHCRPTGENCDQCTITPAVRSNKNGWNEVKNEVIRMGVNVKSGDKFIPKEYLFGSVEQRLSLLRGLMDSDGSCSKNRTSYTSTSKKLIDDLRFLVQSLGGTAIYQKTGREDLYCLNVKMKVNPFLVESKASRWSFSWKNPPSRHITDVVLVGKDEHVCIKVDADDSLYMTDNFIVTHNTTTLTMVSHALSDRKGLYLAFNKSIATEAKKKFAKSVDCRTVHSLAYAYTPKKLLDKMSLPRLFPNNVTEMFNVNNFYLNDEDCGFIKADIVSSTALNALSTYCNSADDIVMRDHVKLNEVLMSKLGKQAGEFEGVVVSIARKLWDAAIDVNSRVPVGHDIYLKYFALQKIKLDVDYLMLDESQDSNGVTLDIVKNQDCQKIIVGDKYQEMYQFRGSLNAMSKIGGKNLYLTKSFRFGDNVEGLANKILERLDCKMPLVGNGDSSGLVFSDNMAHPNAIICRSNAGVLSQLIECLRSKPQLKYKISCNIEEIKSFIFAFEKMKNGDRFTHPVLSAFDSFADLVEYVNENENDPQVSKIVKLIYKFGSRRLLAILSACSKEKNPDVMITTCHKAKGLEWDSVMLGNDYCYEINDDGDLEISDNELMVLYVAVTRAKRNIDIGGISDILTKLDDF